MIGIVNYRLGNIASVKNAISFLKYEYKLLESSEDFDGVDKIILPGVGNFNKGMSNLHKYDLATSLNQKVIHEKVPCLGICLGMQMMFSFSEEGQCEGLDWLNGTVKKIDSVVLKKPNIGWSQVTQIKSSRIMRGIDDPTFYFVHNYYVDGDYENSTSYIDSDVKICASVEKDNIFAVQFHPEKSQKDGLMALSNFLGG